MRAYARDGWRLGGAALGFVLENRALQRFVLISAGIVVVATAGVAVAAVALRREAGPVGYVLVGLAAYYCLSLMVTAVAVGVAGLVADGLESRPVSAATGWRVIARRRGPIAGWAVLDLVLGLPSRLVGSWTVNQLAVLLLGFGWSLLSSSRYRRSRSPEARPGLPPGARCSWCADTGATRSTAPSSRRPRPAPVEGRQGGTRARDPPHARP